MVKFKNVTYNKPVKPYKAGIKDPHGGKGEVTLTGVLTTKRVAFTAHCWVLTEPHSYTNTGQCNVTVASFDSINSALRQAGITDPDRLLFKARYAHACPVDYTVNEQGKITKASPIDTYSLAFKLFWNACQRERLRTNPYDI